MSLARLFHPRGIAIIGASADPARIGAHPLNALVRAGFKGGIYPVNPRYAEIDGRPCYRDAASIPGACDLAVVAVPAAAVPAAIRDCGRKGIGFAVILTAGFREAGAEGEKLEADLKAAIAESGVRAIGPNCQGLLSIPARVWAVFGSVASETELREGRLSCVFQSGGFGYAIVNLAERQGAGFRYCVSSGNETDLTTPDLLDAFLDDEGTSAALAVLEGTPDARRLLDIGRKSLALGKPAMIWKTAATETGARAAASHTANMTGRADLWRAAIRQAGLIEVDDVEPIVDLAKLIDHGRLPSGTAVGVLSISGGSGIVFADRAVRDGLTLPPFSERTVAALREILPAFGSALNPADVTAGVFNDMTLLTRTIEIALADAGIDQLAVLLASLPGEPARKAAEAIAAAAARSSKPVTVAWSGRREKSEAAYAILEAADIPVIPTPVRLATATAKLARFAADRRALRPPPTARPAPANVELPAASGPLSEVASKALLSAFGIPVTREVLVAPGGDALAAAERLTPPFAVKIVSAEIAHKSDIGGVALGIAHAHLAQAVETVTANARRARPDAAIDGVLVAEMASGIEMLIGAVHDEAFGPAVTLAAGGVLAEVMGDVAHRIAPFDLETADAMIAELKSARQLAGYRGSPPADRAALAKLLVQVSDMAVALGPRLAEMDLNPVFVRARGSGVVAADALVVLA